MTAKVLSYDFLTPIMRYPEQLSSTITDHACFPLVGRVCHRVDELKKDDRGFFIDSCTNDTVPLYSTAVAHSWTRTVLQIRNFKKSNSSADVFGKYSSNARNGSHTEQG